MQLFNVALGGRSTSTWSATTACRRTGASSARSRAPSEEIDFDAGYHSPNGFSAARSTRRAATTTKPSTAGRGPDRKRPSPRRGDRGDRAARTRLGPRVQWHPEAGERRELFEAFAEAAWPWRRPAASTSDWITPTPGPPPRATALPVRMACRQLDCLHGVAGPADRDQALAQLVDPLRWCDLDPAVALPTARGEQRRRVALVVAVAPGVWRCVSTSGRCCTSVPPQAMLQHLHPAADAQHRHVARESRVRQRQLEAVALRPRSVRLRVRLRAVAGRVDAGAAREHQAVEQVEQLAHWPPRHPAAAAAPARPPRTRPANTRAGTGCTPRPTHPRKPVRWPRRYRDVRGRLTAARSRGTSPSR